jgi:type II secretory pathway pseudopilin PulG
VSLAAPLIRRRARGFTLAELAIAFLVMSLVLGGLIATYAAQNAARQLAETQRTLENAREALIGFALRHGRLPCPASNAATGIENRRPLAQAETCAVCATTDGFCEGMLPALTLGIGPTDPQGYLVDAWGNRVRYAVTNWVSDAGGFNLANCLAKQYKFCPAFTTANALASLGMVGPPTGPAPALNNHPPMLRICDAAACGGAVFHAPAVISSPGRNYVERLGPPNTFGADELENLDASIPAVVASDGTFVMHDARAKEAASGEFDDIVIWLSPSVLYSRMLSAGAL